MVQEPLDPGSLALRYHPCSWGSSPLAVDSGGFPISKLDVLVESVDPEGPGWFSSFQL